MCQKCPRKILRLFLRFQVLLKAKVEGMLTKLCSMKKAKNSSGQYFDGEIVGCKWKVRVHGYDRVVKAELEMVKHFSCKIIMGLKYLDKCQSFRLHFSIHVNDKLLQKSSAAAQIST